MKHAQVVPGQSLITNSTGRIMNTLAPQELLQDMKYCAAPSSVSAPIRPKNFSGCSGDLLRYV